MKLNDFEVLSFKNGVPQLALEIFTELDRREYERQRPYWEPEDGDEYRLEWAIEYSCSAIHARERLESRGYSNAKAKAAFEEGLQDLVESEDWLFMSQGPDGAFHFNADMVHDFCINLPYRQLLRLLRRLVSGEVVCRGEGPRRSKSSKQFQFICDDYKSFWGFRRVDPVHTIRALAEVCPNGTFTLDITDLARNGWISDEAPLCPGAPQFTILTEGRSDARLLEEALRARRPHMAPYYSFLDFDLGNLGGGASQLVTIVKALVGARLDQRIIAVFDNDSAARDALRGLTMPLPENIRVLILPVLPLARRYPTLGPQGSRATDVNGLAVSLEMFLGRNILCDSSGQLRPVVWTSYVHGVKAYQGEIRDKAVLQREFLDSISSPAGRACQDWSGIDLVLDELCCVFADSAATGYDPYY